MSIKGLYIGMPLDSAKKVAKKLKKKLVYYYENAGEEAGVEYKFEKENINETWNTEQKNETALMMYKITITDTNNCFIGYCPDLTITASWQKKVTSIYIDSKIVKILFNSKDISIEYFVEQFSKSYNISLQKGGDNLGFEVWAHEEKYFLLEIDKHGSISLKSKIKVPEKYEPKLNANFD